MKGYLLDAHIFLNAYSKPEKISRKITRIIMGSSPKYISAISLIEIAQLFETKPKEIKATAPLSTFIDQALSDLQVQVLAITTDHAQRFYEIQLVEEHRDPFDRIIIAQAASTGFTVLSDDRKFAHYPISLLSNRD
ncbi:PIN domain nuclease of toxin-antitoxin system [Spirosoma oryzae]|uniref:PIN domain nuclease of toxin-antitoxin system n=1 Tax=Spirosoma oryzae TaxID=1469603 RepID=A0A2T0SM06_9BACT|nr:type II toxin-antitoxin system VapC family toxin [Spirosoma oryzae]PRY34449.1 PIN domain nuclease of toxin-antitoxin system [Spirosoma oryzae]